MIGWKAGLVPVLLSTATATVHAQSPDWELEAKAMVYAGLRDGGSARFMNMAKVGDTVCGQVNAKNAYGAYQGALSFVVVLPPKSSPSVSGLADLQGTAVIFGTDTRKKAAIYNLCVEN